MIGFVSFQGMTDNARQAAVERAANDVFTAALAADTTPNGKPLEDIEAEYNSSSEDEIQVEIEQDAANDELTVTATGWGGQHIAVRSTNTDIDGNTTPPEDNGNEEEEFTGNINDYEDGVFEFTTNTNNSALFMYGLSNNFTIETPNNGTLDLDDLDVTTEGGIIELPGSGTFTVNGGFEILGLDAPLYIIQRLQYGNQGEIEDMSPEELADLIESLEYYNQNSPIIGRTPFSAGSTITKWEDTGTTDISLAFAASNISKIENIPTTVTHASSMFTGARSIPEYISDWDVSNIQDMSAMFFNVKSFDVDISAWNTESVENMGLMFFGVDFDQNLSNWDVSNVTDMGYMFEATKNFNNDGRPLDWETHNVKDMTGMFHEAKAFNQDLSSWNVSNVIDFNEFADNSPLENNADKLPNFTN